MGMIDDWACRVLDSAGHHVGNLKWMHGVWKFKAIGHDAAGGVIPGAIYKMRLSPGHIHRPRKPSEAADPSGPGDGS